MSTLLHLALAVLVFFAVPLYLLGGFWHGRRGSNRPTVARELERCAVDVTDWPAEKVERLLHDIRHADELIEAEHHIARHHRRRESLTAVQERQAVADLNAYRLRRVDNVVPFTSDKARPRGADTPGAMTGRKSSDG